MQRIMTAFLATALLATVFAGLTWAADETPGWYLDAELALVGTSGNSESGTLGFGGKLRRVYTNSQLTFTGGATQTESSVITRTATGSPTDFTVSKDKVTETTAELYFLRGWYRRDFSARFFGFGGVDWLRNRFAGIDSRTLLALGAGNTWKKSDTFNFDTFYSLTYTFQDDVVENPFVKSEFPGFRFGYNLNSTLSSTTDFESRLIGDWNLDNTDDLRFDWYNALPVGISESLLLKPAIQLLWRNQPSLTNVPLVDGGGVPTGDTVTTPLDKLDTVYTLALVVKIGPKAE